MAVAHRARRATAAHLAVVLPRALALLVLGTAAGSQLRQSRAERAEFAVVRPFWAGELGDLSGAAAAPRPCLPGAALPVDLVLYFAGRPTDVVEGASSAAVLLKGLAERLGNECFQSVRVEYSIVAPETKYPIAACRQFVNMYSGSLPLWGYDAVYYMELDVTPMRAGWLETILPALREAAAGGSWVIGGTADESCMQAGPNVDTSFHSSPHINGNAVYSSVDAYVQRVLAHGPKCELPWDQGASFDFAMWEAAAGDDSIRAKWREDAAFKNCKPSGDHHNAGYDRTVGIKKLGREFPHAVLVHSTYPPLA